MKRILISIAVVIVLLPVVVLGYLCFAPEGYPFASGVHITVRNSGQEAMRGVTIHVTGRVYAIGDLAPGSARTQQVRPTSESSFAIHYDDEQGKRIRLDGRGYFEPGYRGRIEIEVRDGKVITVKDEVRIGLY